MHNNPLRFRTNSKIYVYERIYIFNSINSQNIAVCPWIDYWTQCFVNTHCFDIRYPLSVCTSVCVFIYFYYYFSFNSTKWISGVLIFCLVLKFNGRLEIYRTILFKTAYLINSMVHQCESEMSSSRRKTWKFIAQSVYFDLFVLLPSWCHSNILIS